MTAPNGCAVITLLASAQDDHARIALPATLPLSWRLAGVRRFACISLARSSTWQPGAPRGADRNATARRSHPPAGHGPGEDARIDPGVSDASGILAGGDRLEQGDLVLGCRKGRGAWSISVPRGDRSGRGANHRPRHAARSGSHREGGQQLDQRIPHPRRRTASPVLSGANRESRGAHFFSRWPAHARRSERRGLVV